MDLCHAQFTIYVRDGEYVFPPYLRIDKPPYVTAEWKFAAIELEWDDFKDDNLNSRCANILDSYRTSGCLQVLPDTCLQLPIMVEADRIG